MELLLYGIGLFLLLAIVRFFWAVIKLFWALVVLAVALNYYFNNTTTTADKVQAAFERGLHSSEEKK